MEEAGEAVPPGYSRNKKKTLEELFKPPLDIMFQVGENNLVVEAGRCRPLACRNPRIEIYRTPARCNFWRHFWSCIFADNFIKRPTLFVKVASIWNFTYIPAF